MKAHEFTRVSHVCAISKKLELGNLYIMSGGECLEKIGRGLVDNIFGETLVNVWKLGCGTSANNI